MSFVAPSQKRLVWPVAIALTCAMLVALFLYLPTRTPTTGTATPVAAPGVEQADWDLRIFPAGAAGGGKLTPAAKARVGAQKAPIAALVKTVYDALFLAPAELERAVGRSFTRPAAARALRAEIGLPAGAREVRLTRRTVRAGVEAHGAKRAAARVVIAGKATVDGRPIRFEHDANLWLERSSKSWKVIGFDVVQGPKSGGSNKRTNAQAGKR